MTISYVTPTGTTIELPSSSPGIPSSTNRGTITELGSDGWIQMKPQNPDPLAIKVWVNIRHMSRISTQ
jgi:hypothetical protein